MQGAAEYNCPLPQLSVFGCGEAALGTRVGVWLQSHYAVTEVVEAAIVIHAASEVHRLGERCGFLPG